MDAPIVPSKWETHLNFLVNTPNSKELHKLESHIPGLFRTIMQSASALTQLNTILTRKIDNDIVTRNSIAKISHTINLLRPGLVQMVEIVPVLQEVYPQDLNSLSLANLENMNKHIGSVGHLMLYNLAFREQLRNYLEKFIQSSTHNHETHLVIVEFAKLCSSLNKIDSKFLPSKIKEFTTGKQTIKFADDVPVTLRNYKVALLYLNSQDLTPLHTLSSILFEKMLLAFYSPEISKMVSPHFEYDELFTLIDFGIASGNHYLLDNCFVILDQKTRDDKELFSDSGSCKAYSKAFEIAQRTKNQSLVTHLSEVLEKHSSVVTVTSNNLDVHPFTMLINNLPKDFLHILNDHLRSICSVAETAQIKSIKDVNRFISGIKASHAAADKLELPKSYEPVANLIKIVMTTLAKEESIKALKMIKADFPELAIDKAPKNLTEIVEDDFLSFDADTNPGTHITLDLSDLKENELDFDKFICLLDMNIRELKFASSFRIIRKIEALFPAKIIIQTPTLVQRTRDRAYDGFWSWISRWKPEPKDT